MFQVLSAKITSMDNVAGTTRVNLETNSAVAR